MEVFDARALGSRVISGSGMSSSSVLTDSSPMVKRVERNSQTVSPNTTVSVGSEIDGNCRLRGRVLFDGVLRGDLSVEGEVTIGSNGCVRGNVYGTVARVMGSVFGNIHCLERLEVNRTASITGDLYSPKIALEEGAVFKGNCFMGERPDGLLQEDRQFQLSEGGQSQDSLPLDKAQPDSDLSNKDLPD